jgi:hypothetical protein
MSKRKICSTCGEEKELILFVKNSNQCKSCKAIYSKKYQKENKEKIKSQKKLRYEDNREVILVQRKVYYEQNKAQILPVVKQYRILNSETINNNKKEYYQANKTLIKYNVNIYDRERIKTDVIYKLRRYTSKAINSALKRAGSSKKGISVMEFLPYTIQELKEHLEKQFESWMTWENHGTHLSDIYDENNIATWTWQIDHIIPQSVLSYSSMEEDNFQKCWALENLRPLKSIDNIKKGNKLTS